MAHPVESAPHSAKSKRSPQQRSALLSLREHANDDRAQVEDFIARRFAQAFGSTIRSFMPRLFSLRSIDGAICGAFGLRPAQQTLFLERYLDLAVEQEVLRRTGRMCERTAIVEVGHFSGTFPGAVRTLIGQLAPLLALEGFEWVAFTGTGCLRNAFGRMGLSPIEVAIAKPDRLSSVEQSHWGSYYLQAPRVFVGHIGEGWHTLTHGAAAAGFDEVNA